MLINLRGYQLYREKKIFSLCNREFLVWLIFFPTQSQIYLIKPVEIEKDRKIQKLRVE